MGGGVLGRQAASADLGGSPGSGSKGRHSVSWRDSDRRSWASSLAAMACGGSAFVLDVCRCLGQSMEKELHDDKDVGGHVVALSSTGTFGLGDSTPGGFSSAGQQGTAG